MMISINNAVQASYIFIAIFLIAILVLSRRKETKEFFPVSISQELKGFAILAIVFSHIGYFLISDHRFLFPLTIIAGVGVDLFLLLSGYGLVVSGLKKKYSLVAFYKKRLPKLLIPFWIAISAFFVLDFFVLKINYSWIYILRSYAGYFPHADLFQDLNSPLWYFTLILFYYFLFPLVFSRKRPWLSAIIIYFAGYFIIKLNPAWLGNVMSLYKVHYVAFPLGMFIAWLFSSQNFINNIKNKSQVLFSNKILKNILYYFSIIFLIIFIAYFSYYSGVGKGPIQEQFISIVTVIAILFLFLIKKIDFKLFYIFGLYSYEIYLLHWPLLARYDIFYRFMPAEIATILYLVMFLVFGWGLKKISDVILARKS